MPEITLETEKTKLERKLIKERGQEAAASYIADLEHSDKETLEARLLELSKTGQGLINTRNADKELNLLKEKVRAASAPHNENIRRNKDHQRLVSLIISEKFGDKLMDLSKSDSSEDGE